MQISLNLFFLFHSPVIHRYSSVSFYHILSKVLKCCTDHVEFISLPMTDSCLHYEISMSLPSDHVLPFIECSGGLNMIEPSESSGEDVFTLLLVPIVK